MDVHRGLGWTAALLAQPVDELALLLSRQVLSTEEDDPTLADEEGEVLDGRRVGRRGEEVLELHAGRKLLSDGGREGFRLGQTAVRHQRAREGPFGDGHMERVGMWVYV